MKLSIITINYNNAAGLKKTLDSVAAQDLSSISTLHSNLSTLISPLTIEHIIVDGDSTDGSLDVIKDYESCIVHRQLSISLKWVSEKDHGIYNAMNKGIQIAMGIRVVDSFNRSELIKDSNLSSLNSNLSSLNSNLSSLNSPLPQDHYIQILNSGDMLASADVCARMLTHLHQLNQNSLPYEGRVGDGSVDILYGNMIKQDFSTGKIIGKSRQVEYSLRNYYHGTMNHDCCWIKRTLFDTYGLYDENLKIVSDWKWFLMVIGLGHVQPIYVDIDVTIFDASGISETNLSLRNQERRQVLEELLPPAILADYDKHAFDMEQMDRLRRHHLYPLVYFMERVLFKLEKWHIIK